MRSRSHVTQAGRWRERGAAAVEFACVLPILMLVTIGTIEAGRLVVSRLILANAVAAGARTAVVNSTASTSTVQTAVINAAPMLKLNTTTNIKSTDVTTSAASWAARTRGDTVTVTARYTFASMIPLLSRIASKTYTYTSTLTIP